VTIEEGTGPGIDPGGGPSWTPIPGGPSVDPGGGGGGDAPAPPSVPPQDKCPPVPAYPSGADINKNIETAKKMGLASFLNPLKPVIDARALLWFRNQVKNNGPWDYKQQGRQYQDFGNFNYGATGLALGLGETFLLREAGRAQIAAGTSKPEWGDPGSRANPWGGKPPYGDDPDDQEQIKKGFAYYYAKQKGCV